MTMEEEFEIVWRCYPRKIAKATARLAFKKARKLTTIDEMINGITRYVANKPDWMDFKHPATWLRSEGWSDEWEPQQPKAQRYKDSYVPYNVEKYAKPQQPSTPVLSKNHFLNTYGK